MSVVIRDLPGEAAAVEYQAPSATVARALPGGGWTLDFAEESGEPPAPVLFSPLQLLNF